MEQTLFEKTPVPKAYLTLALPVVMGMMITLVYNMVDTYFIALTGNTNLVAGISLSAPVFTLMIAFGDIWGLGGSSLISRLLGEKRMEEAKDVSAFSFWAAIFFSFAVSIILMAFRNQILTVLGANEQTWSYANDYYTWIVIGAVAIIWGLVPTNLLRTEGMSAQAMCGSILGSVVNIILDPICIFTLGLGAAGAAIATVIGNLVADLFYVYVILKKSKQLSFSIRRVKIPLVMFLGILAIGIPASITNTMQSFMATITNNFLIPYGTDKVAAMGIALKVNLISVLILVGFAFGGQPLIGYCYGAKNTKRLKETIRFAYITEGIAALLFTVVMSVSARSIIHAFMDNEEVVQSGMWMLISLQSSMVFMSIVLVSTCICQSFGKAVGATVLSISRQGVVYAIVIVTFANMFGYVGVLISQPVADIITAVIAIVFVRKYLK